jgi:hypothetical protein
MASSIPSLDRTLDISFLVDTGASLTSISPSDLLSLGLDVLADLPAEPGPVPLTSVGGPVTWWLTNAVLAFTHDDGAITQISVPIALVPALRSPSLLGRDILNKGTLLYDGRAASLTFDIEPGEVRL